MKFTETVGELSVNVKAKDLKDNVGHWTITGGTNSNVTYRVTPDPTKDKTRCNAWLKAVRKTKESRLRPPNEPLPAFNHSTFDTSACVVDLQGKVHVTENNQPSQPWKLDGTSWWSIP